jgi:pimeloyl-ACP methyl ester carboxylesterase
MCPVVAMWVKGWSWRRAGVLAALCCAMVLCAIPTSGRAPERVALPRLVKATLPAQCSGAGARCQERLPLASGWQLTVYRNVALAGSPAITHALVVVHGSGRDPVATFTGMMAASAKVGVGDHTLVVAPWFKAREDHPGEDEPSWTSDGWKQGDGALRPAGLSSFAVLDEIVAMLADKARFPNLNWITLVGHSAGGQFMQRYAAFGREPSQVRGAAVNFVTANPSSFVYFGPQRPGSGGFSVPAAPRCPKYDDYKYGLANRTGYVAALTGAQAFALYTSRRVTIINGGDDTVDNGDLDTNCAAMLEGPNRAVRGANYLSYIRQLAPRAPHDRIVVPGVGHDHYALFESPLVAPVLFGVRPGRAGQPAAPAASPALQPSP